MSIPKMLVTAETPTRNVVEKVLHGSGVIAQDFGRHLMKWTLSCRTAVYDQGLACNTLRIKSNIHFARKYAHIMRGILRRIYVDPRAWVPAYGTEMVDWINKNAEPMNLISTLSNQSNITTTPERPLVSNGQTTESVTTIDATQRVLPFPQLLAYEESLQRYRRGVRPIAYFPSLHAYHGVYCPSTVEGSLYRTLLRWFRYTIREERCWKAIDWCSQSGFLSWGLLVNGVRHLICVDQHVRALRSTKEHLKKNAGPEKYERWEGTGRVTYVAYPDSLREASSFRDETEIKNSFAIEYFCPETLEGVKVDLVTTHIGLPELSVTPLTDLSSFYSQVRQSRRSSILSFLELCEKKLLRCEGRYVAIISQNYHWLLSDETLPFSEIETSKWELILEERCSLSEKKGILGSAEADLTTLITRPPIPRSSTSATNTTTQTKKDGPHCDFTWAQDYLRDVSAHLWILRLRGERENTPYRISSSHDPDSFIPEGQPCAWKDTRDYALYQPKEGPLDAAPGATIPSFSFLGGGHNRYDFDFLPTALPPLTKEEKERLANMRRGNVGLTPHFSVQTPTPKRNPLNFRTGPDEEQKMIRRLRREKEMARKQIELLNFLSQKGL